MPAPNAAVAVAAVPVPAPNAAVAVAAVAVAPNAAVAVSVPAGTVDAAPTAELLFSVAFLFAGFFAGLHAQVSL